MLLNKLSAKPAPRLHPARRPSLCVVRSAVQVADSPQSVGQPLLKNVQFHQPMWHTVTSEQKFFGVLQKLVDSGKMPAKMIPHWQDFYDSYKSAIYNSGQAEAEKLVAQVQASIADNVLLQAVDPYTFPSYHDRITEPYNYYEFGQRYVASLIDFDNSVLGQPMKWKTIEDLIQRKHNVVLLANHQTEADPGVFAHMLADTCPALATDVIYVAGDRVVTDAMCKPFSMGRNLFCVHSKKHMDDIPELKASKMETNRKTLSAMQKKLNEGGVLMWIAPSGGRDRPKGEDNDYSPDPFDPAATDLMRNLLARAKQPGHLFPMAMFSWPVMPAPKVVEKAVGERRVTNWTGVGIALGDALDVVKITYGIEEKEKQQAALAQAAHAASCAEYAKLERAIKDPAYRASNPEFVQPWKKAA